MSVLERMADNIEFDSTITNINEIEKLIDVVCEKLAINEDYYGNMLIALTEAVNNAIVHGNKEDPTKFVKVNFETKENLILFTVKDQGTGFDLNFVPDPTKPENIHNLSGRGVFLMQHLADEVLFEENGTKITLSFNISIS